MQTCAHWYSLEDMERLLAAYITHDQDNGGSHFVRDVVKEIRGLSGTAKQKAVLDACGMSRMRLDSLCNGDGMDHKAVAALLKAMKDNSAEVKPSALGVIGKEHLLQRFCEYGCDEKTFTYKKLTDVDNGVPMVVETAFAMLRDESAYRHIVTGVNWSGNVLKFESGNFTQKILPQYIEENGCEDWDIVFDARGSLAEPHTKKKVPLGTLDVRKYLRDAETGEDVDLSYEEVDDDFPTCGPNNRFSAILFIEKEGFLPLFKKVNLAKRYDIAIMSTKGMSVVAARSLVENICADFDVPLLILRDFDKVGFAIAATFQRDTDRYQFCKKFKVVDLGLRLDDVKKWKLIPEEDFYKSDPRSNLRRNGATKEEMTYLYEGCRSSGRKELHYGKRVELNAFHSDDLIKWIESKLAEQGIKKVVPDTDTLHEAYARAIKVAVINQVIEAAMGDANEAAENHPVPKTLVCQIRKQLQKKPELPWDEVVAKIAERTVAAAGE